MRVPCLLLLAADEESDNAKASGDPSAQPPVKGYTLLPQTFKNDHSKVLEEFSRNQIPVLFNAQYKQDPPMEAKTLLLFEAEVTSTSPESETKHGFTSSESKNESVSSPPLMRMRVRVGGIKCQRTFFGNMTSANKAPEWRWLQNKLGDCFDSYSQKAISASGAIDEENLEVIDQLLRHGTIIRYGFYGCTIWHFAVGRGQEEFAKLLIRHQVTVHTGKLSDWENLVSTAVRDGFAHIVELFLKCGCFETSDFPVTIALSAFTPSLSDEKVIKICRQILEFWAKGNMNDNIHCLLRKSVTKHSPDLVQLILSCCSCLSSDEFNKGTFHIAFLHREEGPEELRCFEKMEEYGFKIDLNVETSSLLLFGAIVNDWLDVVRRLVENGANINEVFSYEGGSLSEEESANYYDVNLQSHAKCEDYDKRLPCLRSGKGRGRGERGRSVNTLVSHKKYTPLHMAAVCSGESVIEVLLKHGAHANAKLGKRTPIYDAVEANNLNAVKALISSGANVRHNPELISFAVKCGHPEIVELLLFNRVLLSTEDSELQRLLAIAVAEDKVEVIRVLLKLGARPNAEFAGRLRRTRELGDNAKKIFQAVVNYCFTDSDYKDTLDIFYSVYRRKMYHQYTSWLLQRNCNSSTVDAYHDATLRYKIKLKSAGLMSEVKEDNFSHTTEIVDECQTICEAEVGQLRNERVGNMDATFCDILTGSVHQLALNAKHIEVSEDNFSHTTNIVDEYQKICEAEVEQLKNERVGNMDATFYDILTGTVHQLALYAKHIDFVATMTEGDYKNQFPIYSSILSCQFAKGTHRKELLARSSKIFSTLSVEFKKLPRTVKEQVMIPLNNYYLEVLNYEFERFTAGTNDT